MTARATTRRAERPQAQLPRAPNTGSARPQPRGRTCREQVYGISCEQHAGHTGPHRRSALQW